MSIGIENLRNLLRSFFGGGADIGVSNPLELSEPKFGELTGLARHKFRKYRLAPVLPLGAPATWDDTGIGEISIVRRGSTYYLYYDGWNAAGQHRIGLATSTDLITWTKEPTNPVLTVGGIGAWDEINVDDMAVIYFPLTGQWMMWYTGLAADRTTEQVGLATSTDGINWTKHDNNPVVPVGSSGEFDERNVSDPSVIYFKGTYYMCYQAISLPFDPANALRGHSTGLATSPDGIIWTKQGKILPYGAKPNSWSAGVLLITKLYHLGNYVLGYTIGSSDTLWTDPISLGFLLTSDFLTWEDFPFNAPIGPGILPDGELLFSHNEDAIYGVDWGGASGTSLYILPKKRGAQIPILMIDLSTLAGAATSTLANCLEVDLGQIERLAITVECTYDAAATTGIRVHVRTSVDNTNWDTEDWDTWTPGGFASGATIRQTKVYETDPKYIKVLVENLDAVAGHAITDIKVTAILGAK